MATVKISSKYQIVIPKEIRERLGLKPGQKVHVLMFKGRATIVPVRPLEELRGMAKGVDISGYREEVEEPRWP